MDAMTEADHPSAWKDWRDPEDDPPTGDSRIVLVLWYCLEPGDCYPHPAFNVETTRSEYLDDYLDDTEEAGRLWRLVGWRELPTAHATPRCALTSADRRKLQRRLASRREADERVFGVSRATNPLLDPTD